MKQQLTILVLGEIPKAVRGAVFQTQILKSAPHYFEMSVPHQVILGEENIKIENRELRVQLKGYPPDILILETSTEVENVFDESIFDLEDKIYKACFEILKRRGGNEHLSEMYSVFTVSNYEGGAEQFMKHRTIIASLLKSERLTLDPQEIEYTLSTQIKYGKNDLAIIDWDGAFLFDDDGDVEQTIELLTLANLQLLRHRILDGQLDERLEKMAKLVRKLKEEPFVKNQKALAEDLRKAIETRLSSVSQFQVLDRDIKLIGDWYSARIYDLTVKKFKIVEWRTAIKEKLESIEDVYSIFVENFSISKKDRAEWIQIVLFFILQVGWFVLLVLEFLYFTR